MKRAFIYSLVFLGFSTMLVQCVATQQDVEYTNVKVRQMDTKVEDIDKEIAELRKQTLAQTGDRLDYQQTELLRLQSEIEEQQFLIKQVQEENRELKKLLQAKIDASEKSSLTEIKKLNDRIILSEEQQLKAQDRLTLAENEIMAIKEARSVEAADRAREAAQRAREAEKMAQLAAEREAAEREAAARQSRSSGPKEILPDTYKVDVSSQNITEVSTEEKEDEEVQQKPEVKAEVPSSAPAVIPAPAAKAATTSYDQGLSLFKEKKYRDAYNTFAEYLDKNPTGTQAVEARYYAAESLYEDKDFELAILEFQKVIVENPQHSLAPKALYRQGLSFEKIGDPETARIVYNKLIDTYPKSDEAGPAKNRIDALKK